MLLALVEPARVDRLVLVSPAGLVPYARILTRLVTMSERVAMPIVGLPRLPRIPEAAFAMLFRAVFPSQPEIAARYTRGYAAGVASPEYPLYVRAAFRALRGTLRQPMLPSATGIESPTLIIWGTKDVLLPVRAAPRLRRAIPRARLLVYEGSGHCPMIDQAERWNRDVQRFLDGESVGE
jgi:pimeloyl-ACP methyl ester carboxylesterase